MSSHPIRLTTSDGETVTFDCDQDETIVEAAARADLVIPTLCGEGNCGTCRGVCSAGEFTLGSHNPAALSTAEVSRGETLLCRTYPKTALDLTVNLSRSALDSGVGVREAEVVCVEAVGGNTVRLLLRLRPDENESQAAEFEPGQFMQLTTPDGDVTRAYSLSNMPNWSGELEFLIRLQPNGKFSRWLQESATAGQVLSIYGPLGSFVLRESGLKPRWFVGGGTGLAPLLSMLRRMADWQEPHPTRLYVGVNTEEELFAQEALAELKRNRPDLVVELCVWKPSGNWQGFAGTPIDALKRDLISAMVKPDLYLCGPAVFVARAEECALVNGLLPSNIIVERFLPS